MKLQKTWFPILPVLLNSCAQAQTPAQSSAQTSTASSPTSPSGAPAKPTTMIGKCPVFPADNIWNTRVDRFPVDPNSAAYISSIGADKPVHQLIVRTQGRA